MASEAKRRPALFDDSGDESDGGADLKINDQYAKRFEHNKKREELQRLEEKYKSKNTNKNSAHDEDDEADSSSDETEDENGFLATEELDAQISATLQAIKTRDPRLYDGKTTFYTQDADGAEASPDTAQPKKEKPIYLQDYHRERILRGDTGADDENQEEPPQTYAQEQDSLKRSIRDEIKAQLKTGDVQDESDEDEDFIKAKEETRTIPDSGVHPSRAELVKAPKPDIKDADKDPELFLSNFLSSRAWVEENENGWKAFESDEGEDDKADEWEAAYNLRFEDPSKSNEVLKSYSREVVAARSVRRDDKSGRKRMRDLERERKEAEKQERKAERARLRKLKLDEAEAKLDKIKKAAGIRGKVLKDEEWQKLLEDAWENDQWEEEMTKTFNDQYYAEAEEASEDDDEASGSKKIKKPKWDDDIDIKDIVPDFEDDERPKITLTDDEDAQEDEEDGDDADDAPAAKRQKTTKERRKEKLASQKAVRQERVRLEALVDKHMDLDDPEILAAGGGSSSSSSRPGGGGGAPGFAYRETKPESFGLTTRDILMASDADLNAYAGLKKLAHFRDADKQAKDRKRLGKKARLRQWRKDTFGPEFEREPPAFNPGRIDDPRLPSASASAADADGGGDGSAAPASNVVEGASKKKRKRSRAKKGGSGNAAAAAEA
ncbi:KRI1-like family C-terminal-domain-containing protein [Xylariaceae sp. FL0804]|nr:KRI1-like family C-terminal-domain-containing protein [Xylariaceae sp. FL0804]